MDLKLTGEEAQLFTAEHVKHALERKGKEKEKGKKRKGKEKGNGKKVKGKERERVVTQHD